MVAVEDPQAPDVVVVLEAHLAFTREVTPEGHVHALPLEGLLEPAVTFFTGREDGELLGIGALKRLDAAHAEIKSMHRVAASRRRAVGRGVVEHLIEFARASGYQRVSLETGTMRRSRQRVRCTRASDSRRALRSPTTPTIRTACA